MDIHAPSDHELQTLEAIHFTSDADWDPSILDSEVSHEDIHVEDDLPPPAVTASEHVDHDLNIYSCLHASQPHVTLSINRNIIPKKPNYELLRPHFG